MQRVSSLLPSWDKRNSSSSSATKPAGLFGWAARNSASHASSTAAASLSRIDVATANAARVRREAFWPSTLDMECVKAARILKSFCTDGYLAPADEPSKDSQSSQSAQFDRSASMSASQSPVKVTKKIPRRIIQNAAGIAVFTCMRSGLWMTGSGGSGILIARKSDGTWSPPSGIMLHTPTLSFIIGVDVYDCVLVVTNLSALESITRPRVILGEDVGLNNGPSVTVESDQGGAFDWKNLDNNVLAYMKARGQHQAVNLNGCILTERSNENERFYGPNITQTDVLAGNVARHIDETKSLYEVIKLAEGRTDYDRSVVELTAIEPAPGDALIASPKSPKAMNSAPRPSFGIPKADDPDPFGVLALEMAGLEIREAGSRPRPTSSLVDMHLDLRSPVSSKFDRQSMDTLASKSQRASIRSAATVKSHSTDAGTQTDVGTGNTPETSPSPGQSEAGREGVFIDQVAAQEIDFTAKDECHLEHLRSQHPHSDDQPAVPPRNRPLSYDPASRAVESADVQGEVVNGKSKETEYDTNDADDEDDLDESDEEPVVFEVAQIQPARTRAVASRVIHAKGNVVNIPKRIPPPLPTRSPARNSRGAPGELGVETEIVQSPLRQAFSEFDLGTEEEQKSPEGVGQRQAGTETSEVTPVKGGPSSSVGGSANTTDSAETIAGTMQRGSDAQVQNETGASIIRIRRVTKSGEAQEGQLPQEDLKDLHQSGEQDGQAQDALYEQTDALDVDMTVAVNTPLPEEDVSEQQSLTASEGTESAYDFVQSLFLDEDEPIRTTHERIDTSDSTTSKKHTSSVYTGLTEDRWSIDRSTLTTPTSDRPVSVAEYSTEDDTPKKLAKEEALQVQKQAQKMATVKTVKSLPRNATTFA